MSGIAGFSISSHYIFIPIVASGLLLLGGGGGISIDFQFKSFFYFFLLYFDLYWHK